MADNLWELRQRRNLTVKQLAGKSGVPATNIYGYEGGDFIKLADLNKLAKALYVNNADIKNPSDPRPKSKPEKPTPPPKPVAERPSPVAERPSPVAERPSSTTEQPSSVAERPSLPDKQPTSQRPRLNQWQKKKAKRSTTPATEGQINHLHILAARLAYDETAVVERAGKPLAELNYGEASALIHAYNEELKTHKTKIEGERPPDTRRWRAHLPEGADEFEANYLTARQEAGDDLTFTLLNDTIFTGHIVGFSPYTITLRQADGVEITLQKLALAYYSVTPAPANPTVTPENSDESE